MPARAVRPMILRLQRWLDDVDVLVDGVEEGVCEMYPWATT